MNEQHHICSSAGITSPSKPRDPNQLVVNPRIRAAICCNNTSLLLTASLKRTRAASSTHNTAREMFLSHKPGSTFIRDILSSQHFTIMESCNERIHTEKWGENERCCDRFAGPVRSKISRCYSCLDTFYGSQESSESSRHFA